MENRLIAELTPLMPKGVAVPEAIQQLYAWIEAHGLYVDNDGGRVGFLYPVHAQRGYWPDEGRPGGTDIEFAASGGAHMKYWFGGDHPEVSERLCLFGRTGNDGSECAFWLNEREELKIVHLGSGSGSELCCVLAESAVDFLRLLAIGYDEICWPEQFPFPPNTLDPDYRVEPNHEFREWVQTTFGVDIPATALAIVQHPADIGDEDSPDEFCRWCARFAG